MAGAQLPLAGRLRRNDRIMGDHVMKHPCKCPPPPPPQQNALCSLSEWRSARWAHAAGTKHDGQVSVYQSEVEEPLPTVRRLASKASKVTT